MKSISYVAYGDIGSQTGRSITELARGLDRHDSLNQVYCRGVEKYHIDKDTITCPIPLGRHIPRMLSGVNRFFIDEFDNRYYSERMFDFFSSRYISDGSIDLHHTPGYIKCIRRGNEIDNRTVVKATSEYVEQSNSRLQKEYHKLEDEFEEVEFDSRMLVNQERAHSREKSLKECDQILAISKFVKRSLVKSGFRPSKIDVTSLGVDPESYPTSPPSRGKKPFTVLYIGSVTVAKGIPYLLKAWERNGWGESGDVRLLLCGHVSSAMKKIISQYNFDNVRTPGYVDPREYHQKASVFVFPSISDGFGKAPLEAMAAGIPVIATNHTGMPDIIDNGEEGYIIPARDANVLAARLDQLRENPKIRKGMRECALKTAQAQTWEEHTKLVMRAIK